MPEQGACDVAGSNWVESVHRFSRLYLVLLSMTADDYVHLRSHGKDKLPAWDVPPYTSSP